MAPSPPLLLRVLALSATAAARAGKIIRDVKEGGNLGVIEKVCKLKYKHLESSFCL